MTKTKQNNLISAEHDQQCTCNECLPFDMETLDYATEWEVACSIADSKLEASALQNLSDMFEFEELCTCTTNHICEGCTESLKNYPW